eukprot:1260084-Amphidinium_carterae.1
MMVESRSFRSRADVPHSTWRAQLMENVQVGTFAISTNQLSSCQAGVHGPLWSNTDVHSSLCSCMTFCHIGRPKYEMTALALHEGLPGHHFQARLGFVNMSVPGCDILCLAMILRPLSVWEP